MKRTRFGIVGTGRISDWVLKGAVMDPRFEAAAVCSRSEEKGKAFAASHGIGKVYTDIKKMAADPEIDAVYIGTPNDTHKALAVLCLNHGKHVLCEKPLAANAMEVKEMIAAAKANGVMLMEAMISTLCPNFAAARKRMESLGNVRHYFASFCQYSTKYDLVKRIIAGKDDSPVPSSLNPRCCGGALMDIGIYTIFPMVALFGMPEGIKAEVMTCEVPVFEGSPASQTNIGGAEAGHYGKDSGRYGQKVWERIDLQGSVVFEYAGMSASVIYSKIADSRLRTEISCDGGIVSLDQVHICREARMSLRGAPTSGRSSGPQAIDISVPNDPDEYLCEFREFIDVLEDGRVESSVNSLGISLATAEVLDEIRRQAGVVFPADRTGNR